MKKLSAKDQLLLLFLAVAGIVFAFYMYVYVPMEEKNKTLAEQRDNLKIEVGVKNVDSQKSKSTQLQNELKLHEEEKKEFELERMITREQQERLLLYIGDKANELGINLVKFEEKNTETSSYSVVGYNIKARGDSKDLVLFMNSLYSFYNYCFITDLNLRKVEVIPTFEAEKLEGLSEEEKSRIGWEDEHINLVLLDIPPYILENDVDESTSSQETTFEKELQLDFSLYFILSD